MSGLKQRIIVMTVCLIGFIVSPAPREDERGLSQSTENAVLLAGAVAVATIVVTAVRAYVSANMPS